MDIQESFVKIFNWKLSIKKRCKNRFEKECLERFSFMFLGAEWNLIILCYVAGENRNGDWKKNTDAFNEV